MTATIIGGNGVNFALDPTQTAIASAALAAAFQGYSVSNVLTAQNDTPTPGDYNIYNIFNLVSDGGTDTMNPGGQAFVLLGANAETVIGNGGNVVLVGNAGNDTFDAVGGAGTIVTGIGSTVINLNNTGVAGGSQTIDAGSGSDTVNMWGGAVTVSVEAGGHLKVNALAGANSVTGNATISLSPGASVVASGNDTISFGSGADTVVEVGTATVAAGAIGNVTVSAGSGANSVAAGAGNSTLIGGSGADTFAGGVGSSSMVGGSSANVFSGATGHDTMVGNLGAASNLFSFASTQSGGTHTIDNFVTGQDQLKLVGYTTATALADANVVGGNTVIHFADSTTITLVGYTTLTGSDITH